MINGGFDLQEYPILRWMAGPQYRSCHPRILSTIRRWLVSAVYSDGPSIMSTRVA
jgi:hypothetical protein